jgi:hypothetical protein
MAHTLELVFPDYHNKQLFIEHLMTDFFTDGSFGRKFNISPKTNKDDMSPDDKIYIDWVAEINRKSDIVATMTHSTKLTI